MPVVKTTCSWAGACPRFRRNWLSQCIVQVSLFFCYRGRATGVTVKQSILHQEVSRGRPGSVGWLYSKGPPSWSTPAASLLFTEHAKTGKSGRVMRDLPYMLQKPHPFGRFLQSCILASTATGIAGFRRRSENNNKRGVSMSRSVKVSDAGPVDEPCEPKPRGAECSSREVSEYLQR